MTKRKHCVTYYWKNVLRCKYSSISASPDICLQHLLIVVLFCYANNSMCRARKLLVFVAVEPLCSLFYIL